MTVTPESVVFFQELPESTKRFKAQQKLNREAKKPQAKT